MNAQRGIVIGIILLAVLSAGILLVRPASDASYSERGDGVLVLRLYGGIQETGSGLLAMQGTITPAGVAHHLNMAKANRSVKAVVLRISSPGGSVAASQEIYNMIKRFPKPIVVSMGDQAASGGYYIAAAADGIVANPGTMTGSIGVITAMTKFDQLYENLGIELEIIKSGEHKDMFQRELTAEERQLLQDLNDDAWNQFVQAVAEGRNLDIEHVQRLATGEVFTGNQAINLGLVDRLGDLHEAVLYAGELAGLENPVVIEPRSPSLWQQLMGMTAGLVGAIRGQGLGTPLELIQALEGIPNLRYSVSF